MLEVTAIAAVMRACLPMGHVAPFMSGLAAGEEVTVVELTRTVGVTQGAVSQHLKSLKLAGLVADRAQGRNVYYRARPEGLAPLVDWMDHYAAFWRERFTNLRTLLKEIDP